MTTEYCLPPPVAPANSPVPPVTVTVAATRYRVYEEVVADTQTVPFNEKVNWLPFDAVVVTEPVTGLPAPGPHGGGGLAATCEPLVVPRNIGVPKTWPTLVVTSCTVDVIVPLPISTYGTTFHPVGVADAEPSKKVRPRTATTVKMQVLLTGPLSGEGPSRSRFDRYALVRLFVRRRRSAVCPNRRPQLSRYHRADCNSHGRATASAHLVGYVLPAPVMPNCPTVPAV